MLLKGFVVDHISKTFATLTLLSGASRHKNAMTYTDIVNNCCVSYLQCNKLSKTSNFYFNHFYLVELIKKYAQFENIWHAKVVFIG